MCDIEKYILMNKIKQCKRQKTKEWLKFKKILDIKSKQGYLGVFTINNEFDVLFKFSKTIDNAIEHECKIMKSMNELAQFVLTLFFFSHIHTKVDPDFKISKRSPFIEDPDYLLQKDIML